MISPHNGEGKQVPHGSTVRGRKHFLASPRFAGRRGIIVMVETCIGIEVVAISQGGDRRGKLFGFNEVKRQKLVDLS